MSRSERCFWIACYPDLPRPIGGVKQMHRLAEAIQACGHRAVLVQESADFHPGWFQSQVSTIARADWIKGTQFTPQRDVVIVAETFLPLIPKLVPGVPKVLFNQNGAYSFGLQGKPLLAPQQVLAMYRHQELRQIWCVSEHDRRLLSLGFGLHTNRVRRIVNGLETEHLKPSGRKKRQVVYMPRKNNADAEVVMALLQQQPWFKDWSLLPIRNCSHAEVVQALQQSLVFLSFGHPEGFGLPVAEALACGCAVVGYSGLGGRELFALAGGYGLGIEVAFGDWLGFVDGVQQLDQRLRQRKDDLLHQLQAMSDELRQRYTAVAMQRSVAAAIRQLDEVP